jgi:hypothetical protein
MRLSLGLSTMKVETSDAAGDGKHESCEVGTEEANEEHR